jgi:hypothetical protein
MLCGPRARAWCARNRERLMLSMLAVRAVLVVLFVMQALGWRMPHWAGKRMVFRWAGLEEGEEEVQPTATSGWKLPKTGKMCVPAHVPHAQPTWHTEGHPPRMLALTQCC